MILNGKKLLLVDTGRKNKRKILISRIDEYQKNGYSLEGLILTHTHFDHAENAAALKERFEIPIFVHGNESVYLSRGENPPNRGTYFLTRCLMYLWEKKLKQYFRYEPAKFDYPVADKYNLDPFGFDAYLIHTPGHSQGSMSLIVDNEIAIVGDAMFGVFKWIVNPPFADDSKMMIRSWGKLLDTGCTVFLPSHGTANGRELLEKQYNKYINIYGF